MKNIVLALALAVVTPAVLAAQENGNAYNQNGNEVIASNTRTETSSVNYWVEGKALYHSDLALARARAERLAKEKEAQTQAPEQKAQKPTKKTKKQKPVKKTETPKPEQQTQAEPVKSDSQAVSITEYGREGKMLSLSTRVQERKAKEKQEADVPNYVKDADKVANNHQVVNQKQSQKSTKRRGKSFRQNLREVRVAVKNAVLRNAQQEK